MLQKIKSCFTTAQGKVPGRDVRRVLLVAAAALALFLCGCSSFNRAWRNAASEPVRADSLEGRWQGRWVSDVNGHNGQLRCLISQQDEGQYAARFRATYMRVLRFSYTVPLTAERSNGVWHFHGEEDLGKMAGGVYRYVGTATSNQFHSTYRSKHDHGVFEMDRVVQDANVP